MNSITVICAVVLVIACQVYSRPQENAAAAPAATSQKAEGNVTLLKNEVVPLDGKGSYSYDIELSDGTKLIQSGHTEAPAMGETEPSIIIEGSYAYVAPDGKQISITYIADKNGFQPKGDAIPTQGSSNSTAPAAAAAAPAPASNPAPAPAAAASAAAPAAEGPAPVADGAAQR